MSRRAPENPVYDPRWTAAMEGVAPPPPLDYRPPTDPWLTVIHQDAEVIAFDKPALLLAVPGKPEGHEDSLERRAEHAYPGARLVHRLDRPTSGVMVFGLTAEAHRRLGRQFEDRKVSKTYIARVSGVVEGEEGVIDAPLCGDWPNRPRQMAHFEHGKPASTAWRVLEREPCGVTRLELKPLTGRTHQLRVHMTWIGHPILGDEFYAPPEIRAAAERLQLHAESLTLKHPMSGEEITIRAECPF